MFNSLANFITCLTGVVWNENWQLTGDIPFPLIQPNSPVTLWQPHCFSSAKSNASHSPTRTCAVRFLDPRERIYDVPCDFHPIRFSSSLQVIMILLDLNPLIFTIPPSFWHHKFWKVLEVISIFTEVKLRKNMNMHKNELEKEFRAGKDHTKPLVELLIR